MDVNEVVVPASGYAVNYGFLFVSCSTAIAVYTKGHWDDGFRELVNYAYTGGTKPKIFSNSSETQYSVYSESGVVKIRKNSDSPLHDPIHIIYIHSI